MRSYDPDDPKTFGSDLFEAHADKLAPCLISIIVPSHNEEGNLLPLYNELVHVLSCRPYRWELIVVDDGSLDGTWREISMLHAQDVHVKGIRLSRNFGHQYALLAGLSHATGQVLISMDADLQHPPRVIPQLLEAWQAGSKIVHTTRIDPPTHSMLKRLTSCSFYRLFALLCGVEISAGRADFRLLDRQVADELLALRESDIFFRGLVHWMGYPSANVTFQARQRLVGVSKYSLPKMMRFAWHGILSFSLVPLRFAIVLGFMTSAVAFLGLMYALFSKLFLPEQTVPGWTSVVAIMSFLFGLLFMVLGVIGEYIGRILQEVRRRPRYLVCEQIGFSVSSPSDTREAAHHHGPSQNG